MDRKRKMLLSVTALCAGVVLFCSCQTSPPKDAMISHLSCDAIPLAKCLELINTQIGAAKGQKEVGSVFVDTTLASIQWIDVSASNSNAAERLVSDYATRAREWEHFIGTNLITFNSGWVSLSLHNVLTILADISGGNTDTIGNKAIIRYGARELQLRQYSHEGWYELFNERRYPEGGDHLADLFGSSCGSNEPMTRYVPENDVVLVLGCGSQQAEFRKLMSDFRTTGTNGMESPNTASHGTALPRRP